MKEGAEKVSVRRELPWKDGMTFLTLGLGALATGPFTGEAAWGRLGLFGVTGLAAAFLYIRKSFRRGQNAVLCNVFLTFTVAFSLFFLFGPLLHVVGPAEQSDYARTWFPVDAGQAVSLMGANLVGFGLALWVGDVVRWRGFSEALARRFAGLPRGDAGKTALLLLTIGLVFKAYVLYNDLVLTRTISGLFRVATLMAPAGVFLHVYRFGLGLNFSSALALLAAIVYATSGLIEFSKTEVFIPLLALIGGMLAQRITMIRILASGVIMGAALVVLQPLNLDARNEALRLISPTYRERIEIFRAAIGGELDVTASAGAWSRLDYTSPQNAAVHLYESGDGGSDFSRLIWAFLPRFLFPNKPVITGASTEFTYKVKGFDTSATAVGVFINGFYNFGWFGLVFVSLTVGLILSWFRAVMEAALKADSVILLCIGLFGHMTAILISGTYLANFLGPFVTMLYLVSGLSFVLSRLRPERKSA